MAVLLARPGWQNLGVYDTACFSAALSLTMEPWTNFTNPTSIVSESKLHVVWIPFDL